MASRRKVVVGGAIAVLVALVLVVWRTRGDDGRDADESGSAAQRTGERAGSSTDGRRAITAAARPGVRVAGIVVTEEGMPVRGASVHLASPRTAATAVTDGVGRFDLGTQPVESYVIAAVLAGRTPAAKTLELRDPTAHADHIRLVLYPCDAAIHGTVRDAGGGVIAGALIAHTPDLQNSGGRAVSAADGSYELCVPPGNAFLMVRADGYATAYDAVSAFGKSRRDFTLSPGAAITGRVVRAGGEAVSDALVAVYGQAERSVIPSHAVSDANGRFTVDDLPAGRYEVRATAAGLATEQPCEAIAEVGTPVEIVCELAPTLTIAGKIVERGGRPVPGLQVGVTSTRTRRGERTSSDVTQADGSFLLEHVFPGEYRPVVEDTEQVFEPITVERTDVSGVVLELERGASLAGRVVHRGKPVGGATVQLRQGSRSTTTDDAGAFAFERLPARTYQLYAESHRVGAFTNGPSITLGANEKRTGVDVELELEGSIEGIVVDQNDRPVAGVYVAFTLLGGRDFGMATTADDGTFAARSLSGGGEYVLEIKDRPAGGIVLPPATGRRFQRFAVLDGQTHLTGVRIRVRWERLSIAGRVTDPAGQPAADVTVDAVSPNTPWMRAPSATSDQTGAFVIRDLTAGTYTVRATGARGAARLEGIAAGRTDIALRLDTPGTLDGTLVGFTDPPEVIAYADQPGQHFRAVVRGTTFQLRQLPAGSYVVVATSAGGSATEHVAVAPGAKATVTLTNPGIGTIVGTVLDAKTRQPVAGARCAVQEMVPSNGGFPISDTAGAFRIDKAPGGKHRVSCWSKERNASQEVTITPGAVTRVELLAEAPKPIALGNAGMRLANDDGVVVAEIKPGGAAARAGVAVGDFVKSVDGRVIAEMYGPDTVTAVIERAGPGAKVKLVLERNDKDITVELTLDARPQPSSE